MNDERQGERFEDLVQPLNFAQHLFIVHHSSFLINLGTKLSTGCNKTDYNLNRVVHIRQGVDPG